jgi:hypothetical protein
MTTQREFTIDEIFDYNKNLFLTEEEEENKDELDKVTPDEIKAFKDIRHTYTAIEELKEIEKYLKIEKNRIIAKKPARVLIDKTEYKEDQITETPEYYLIPGIIEIYFPDDMKFIQLPFTFNVKLKKNDSVVETKNEILIEYQPGDVIIEQKFKAKEISFKTLSRILEGSARFLRTPEQYVLTIAEQLNYTIDLVHIEIIVQQIFRCADDLSKPCRLCDYKNCEIVGISKIPKYTSWLLALEFERVKSVLKHVLVHKTPMKNTAFEKIFLEY